MLGDTGFSYHGKIPQSTIAGPLAVVSVAPCLPGQECQQESRAINFLMEKLKDCPSLSPKKTEQINGWGKYNGVNGRMSEKHVLNAIKQGTIVDLTNSVSSITFQV